MYADESAFQQWSKNLNAEVVLAIHSRVLATIESLWSIDNLGFKVVNTELLEFKSNWYKSC